MAPRQNQSNGGNFDRSAAEDVVFGNLELGDELGGNTDDDDSQLDLDDGQDLDLDDDQGDDPFRPDDTDDDQGELRDLRVTHTEDRQQRREQKPEKTPLPRRSEVTTDKNGNLVNSAGKIVARAGVQARLYQGRERAKRDLSAAQAQNTDLNNRLSQAATLLRRLHTQNEAFKATENKIKEFGLTPQKQLAAMQLYSELESNPQQAIKRILTRAAAGGINLAELGAGGSGGLDAKALAELVKDQVKSLIDPLKERSDAQEQERQQQARQEEELNVIRQETAAFFERNQDALPHLNTFKRVMADPRYRNLSLGEVWARIQRNLLTRGNGQQRSRTPNQGRSIPRGRGAAPSGNSTVADPNQSYGDILNDVLKQTGVPQRV